MESEITFLLNDQEITTTINPSFVLLDYIRKSQKLTGTKEVCKEGDCGACAVLLGEVTDTGVKYKVINSCLYPIHKINKKHVVTIEGLRNSELNLIQKKFLNEGASQCGFCTPGFIISLTEYLFNTEKPNYDEAINAIAGNICRCTGYNSIKKVISNIVLELSVDNSFNINKLSNLVKLSIIPEYFNSIEKKLKILISTSPKKTNTTSNKSIFISGGTDLFVQKPELLLESDVSYGEFDKHEKIKLDGDKIKVPSNLSIEELKVFLNNNNLDLDLSKLFKLFASKPIRNSATIAGNIINASPIADFTIALLALGAEIELNSVNKQTRIMKLAELYLGYKKLNKLPEEIILTIYIPIPKSKSYFNFEKVSKRTHLDIASVNTAMLLEVNDNKIAGARISAGGVSPIPLFLSKTSDFLIGKNISIELVLDAVKIAKSEISPISDIRGSLEYKELLLSQLIKVHFITLFPQIITSEVLV